MRIKKIAVALFMALSLMSPVCLAENLQFVDSNGATGYYVDVDSIAFESDKVVNARIAVKKAAANRMFLYTMNFDAGERRYRILDSQVIQYDTKQVLESATGPNVPMPYGELSPMSIIVEYIFSLS